MCQAIIAILGGATIWLLSTKKYMKWGFLVGLMSEPFWLYSSWKHRQWGIVALCLWYGMAYLRGLINHWGDNADREAA